jgi:hypothetical protein
MQSGKLIGSFDKKTTASLNIYLQIHGKKKRTRSADGVLKPDLAVPCI